LLCAALIQSAAVLQDWERASLKKKVRPPPPPAPPASWPSPPSPPPWPKGSLYWIDNPDTLEVEKAHRLVGRLLPPADVHCAGSSARFGGRGDGGKDVCLDGIQRGNCLVYSAGSRGEILFEKELVKALGCEVHVFDPTLDAQGAAMSFSSVSRSLRKFNATLHNFGLGGADRTYSQGRAPYQWPGLKYGERSNNETWELRTLEGARRRLGHSDRAIDVLKIDVEGAEWALLEHLLSSKSTREMLASGRIVRQILLEVHFPIPPSYHPPWSGVGRKPKVMGYARNPEHGETEDVVAFNQHAQDMLNQLYDLGFRGWRLKTNRHAPKLPVPGPEMEYVNRHWRGWHPDKQEWHMAMLATRCEVSCCHDLSLLWRPPPAAVSPLTY